MIGRLKGIVDAYGDDFVILDVGGVGYEVHCSTRTLQGMPQTGEAMSLSIETVVREDMIRLYGFASAAERAWFRLLTTVQGVGTKVALAILSTLSPSELASAIALNDKAMIARSPGVGPKVAQRIAAELKDKAPALLAGDAGIDPATARLQADLGEGVAAQPAADAVSALVNLGYAQAQASAAVARAVKELGDDAATDKLIRAGLRVLAA